VVAGAADASPPWGSRVTAPERLTQALRPLWGSQGCTELDALADRALVPRKIARMAARGRAVAVSHHLRLAITAGFDPYIEGRTIAPYQLGTFHRARFGETVRHVRREAGQSNLEAAKAFGISTRALSYVENGKDACIETVFAVCRGIGIHPLLFCRECFTVNTDRKALNLLEAAA
jgi:DNA-binding XRE family transcriptional regulator